MTVTRSVLNMKEDNTHSMYILFNFKKKMLRSCIFSTCSVIRPDGTVASVQVVRIVLCVLNRLLELGHKQIMGNDRNARSAQHVNFVIDKKYSRHVRGVSVLITITQVSGTQGIRFSSLFFVMHNAH